MSHRSITLVAALGLGAVLLGASPASAGTAHRIEVEKDVETTSSFVSPRMAERGHQVVQSTPDAPFVSARMAERGYQVRQSDRDGPLVDDCSLRAPCHERVQREILAYTEDGPDRTPRHGIPVAW